jgi:hypothetical protein
MLAIAIDELPAHVEFLCREIYCWFSVSSNRKIEYEKTFSLINTGKTKTCHAVIQPSTTRWLSHSIFKTILCEESDVQYRQLLGYNKTRWLALMPAVERILKMFAPMRSYFLSLEKCPKVLQTFFNTDSSELWLKFVESQASISYNAVKQIEREHITVFETLEQIPSIRQKFNERIKETYLPLLSRSDLTKLVEMGSLTKEWFMSHVNNFYANCVQSLDKWSVQFTDVDNFQWLSCQLGYGRKVSSIYK